MRLFSKIKNIYTGLFVILAAMATTSCQTGLEYEDVPESYYTDVDLRSCYVSSRALSKTASLQRTTMAEKAK